MIRCLFITLLLLICWLFIGYNPVFAEESIPPAPPCAKEISEQGCMTTFTPFGEMATDPQLFVMSVFSIILGLSGGIGLLLFMASGYRMITSQGNPEAVKGSQEMLTAAITGMLFIIFSFIILRFIAIDLLKLPGLS